MRKTSTNLLDFLKTDKSTLLGEMNGGGIPSSDTLNSVSLVANPKSDFKRENNRNAPKFSTLRNYMQINKQSSEEEENSDLEDEDLEDDDLDDEFEDDEFEDLEDADLEFEDDEFEDDEFDEFEDLEDADLEFEDLEDDEFEDDEFEDDEFEDDEFDEFEFDEFEDDEFEDDDILNFNNNDDEFEDDEFDDEEEEEFSNSLLRTAIADINTNTFTPDTSWKDDEEYQFDGDDHRLGNYTYPEEEEDDLGMSDEIEDSEIEDSEIEDSENYSFDQSSRDAANTISDDEIDQIDDATGTISKWWREKLVTPDRSPDGWREDDFTSDGEFEEEEEGNNAVSSQSAVSRQSNMGATKIDQARQAFQQLINQPDMERGDIIAKFVNEINVTHSTAVSYYERLAKEAGITNNKTEDNVGQNQETEDDAFGNTQASQSTLQGDMGAESDDELNDEDRRGIIRSVDDAHLVFKRQTEDGTFEELWIYNAGSTLDDDVAIRRAILAGTDIPRNKTQSEDGSQTYTLETMGNAQMLHIRGMQN